MFWSRKPDKQDIFTRISHILVNDMAADVVVQKKHVLVTVTIDPNMPREAMSRLQEEITNAAQQARHVKTVQVVLTAEKAEATQSSVSGASGRQLSDGQSAGAQLAGAQSAKARSESRAIAPHVKHIIAVASGKGGVGKSTVAANLAVALSKQGLRVGLLDADVYGPSVPTLLGVRNSKPEEEKEYLIPVEAFGLKIMSMGFLVDEEAPMIWRGPMVQSALLQMLRDVRWASEDDPMDVLVLDLPPGTGDTQLTVAQKVKLSGAIIVSTPQDIALLDTVKGVNMFRKVDVPVLGVVENMSFFCCPECGYKADIFGHGGARQRAEALDIPFLGDIPLDIALRDTSDKGVPAASDEQHPLHDVFHALARDVMARLA